MLFLFFHLKNVYKSDNYVIGIETLALTSMKDFYMLQSLVSSKWLNENLNRSNIVVLYTTLIPKMKSIPQEVKTLQISGALFFDLQGVFSDQNSSLPKTIPSEEHFQIGCQKLGISKDSKVVVYDTLGIYSSPRVWFLFKSMGHKEVYVLNGGLRAWLAGGFKTVEKRETKVERSNFYACFHPDFLIDKSRVVEAIKSRSSVVLDARSAARFNGEVPEIRKGLRKGHIPTSGNLYYARLLDEGKYKSMEELKMLFDQYDASTLIIFSCGSGITACILLLAANEIVQNGLLLYDGSWTEWGSSTE